MRKLLFFLSVISVIFTACHKDLGHYEIDMPETPEVVMDSVFTANVGDSLIITPTIKSKDLANIELHWRISVMEGTDVLDTGASLRIIYGLQAKRYPGRLTVYNKANGMKYFHKFFIDGATEFARGTSVLSVENGITQFSFIKPDGTVQARLYRAIHGKDLPANPMNLFLLRNRFTGGTMLGYWIITKNGGVRLEPNTMVEDPKYPNTLSDNFFVAPDNIEVGSLKPHQQGIMAGVINGTLYGGTTNTWDQAPTYGMFGPAEGDYELAPSFIMTQANAGTSFVGFDKNRKQFLRFNVYSGPTYFGTQYGVPSPAAFNPMAVDMDLIHMEQLNNTDCYAYCKSADGKIHELHFTVNFTGPFEFKPLGKREFVRQDLITADTKWQGASNGVIFMTKGEKIYRYNPLNQEVRELVTTFEKPVSMIKLSEDEQILRVGIQGGIYNLDISTGKYGTLIDKVEGIPGSPVDIVVRTN
ncbi:PKD-like family lipoprotein [Pedobacter faecalis]|uniref:PKD-like family lipoprotein n=1 Tax=Pedobacter faecalis TaxID=3041495 RepID=UPI00254EA414|nr:PKD-like family lipoprotein [Pedobacter sp. ELA7]